MLDLSKYRQPDNESGRWRLPDAPQIVADISASACSVSLLISDILEVAFPNGWPPREESILLSALIQVVKKDDESWQQWQELRAIDEERQLFELENKLYRLANRNGAIAKFLLERRAPSQFGKNAKVHQADEQELDAALAELQSGREAW